MAEFKYSPADDPFKDSDPGFEHDSERSEKTLGQICTYATAHMAAQFRSHVFSLLVFPKYARILRWDRAGVIVTGKIDLEKSDEVSVLANFLWRYSNMTDTERGYDENVTRVTPRSHCHSRRCRKAWRKQGFYLFLHQISRQRAILDSKADLHGYRVSHRPIDAFFSCPFLDNEETSLSQRHLEGNPSRHSSGA